MLGGNEFHFTMNDQMKSKSGRNIYKNYLCNCSKRKYFYVKSKFNIKNAIYKCKVTSEGN